MHKNTVKLVSMLLVRCLNVNKAWIKSVNYINQISLFRRLGLNHLIHMDYIYDLFMNLLKLQYLGGMKVEFQKRYQHLAGLIKSILI